MGRLRRSWRGVTATAASCFSVMAATFLPVVPHFHAPPASAAVDPAAAEAITEVSPPVGLPSAIHVSGVCVPSWGTVTVQWRNWLPSDGPQDSSTAQCAEDGTYGASLALGPGESAIVRTNGPSVDPIATTQENEPPNIDPPCARYSFGLGFTEVPGNLAFMSPAISGSPSASAVFAPVTVGLQRSGQKATTSSPLAVSIESTSGSTEFSKAQDGVAATKGQSDVDGVIPTGGSSLTSYYRETAVGTPTLVACTPGTADPGYLPAAQTEGVSAQSLDLSQSSGPVGATVLATAAGFRAQEEVDIVDDGADVGSCTAGTNGGCSANVTVPERPGGRSAMEAMGLSSGLTATTDFTETPSVSIGPTAGPAGSTPIARANGFAAAETVTFSYDTVPVGHCTADSTGACRATITVPAEPAGGYLIDALGSSSASQATTTFTETGGRARSR